MNFPTGPVRLGDLIAEAKLLWLYCRSCGHEVDLDPATLPLPADVPVPQIGQRMRCSVCGSKAIDAKPELYPGGVVAQRARCRGGG